jgi:(1->4)-alpha-D-glucan 1-alpha-D-glucosylmutase
LLKATSPGIPDFYQGSELWDFSFVDPDNRHPVDLKLRHRLLAELRYQLSQHNDDFASTKGWISELQRRWPSGEVKLYLIWRALGLRRRHRELFDDGAYVPLSVFGVKGEHACAFARQLGSQQTISIAPRLVVGLTNGSERPPIGRDVWQDTAITVPNTRAGDFFRNVFTNERIEVREHDGQPGLVIAEALSTFPVALLEKANLPTAP